jgi:glycosyltransferase involved in cell wall biosynthesis
MGKVAVITATRNRGGTLEDPGYLFPCIASVYHQDYDDHIHMIVDDGSTDQTKELVERCAEKDPRIIYLRREKLPCERDTASCAQNYGIEITMRLKISDDYSGPLADVDYITILHSDDLLPHDSLSSRVRAMKKQEAGIVYGQKSVIDWSGLRVLVNGNFPPFTDPKKLYKRIATRHSAFPNHSLMWDLDTLAGIGMYDEGLGDSEDDEMSLRTMDYARNNSHNVAFTGKVEYLHRYHDGMITHPNRRQGHARRDHSAIRKKHGIGPGVLLTSPFLLKKPHAFLPLHIKDRLEAVKNNFLRVLAEDDSELIEMQKGANGLWNSLDI